MINYIEPTWKGNLYLFRDLNIMKEYLDHHLDEDFRLSMSFNIFRRLFNGYPNNHHARSILDSNTIKFIYIQNDGEYIWSSFPWKIGSYPQTYNHDCRFQHKYRSYLDNPHNLDRFRKSIYSDKFNLLLSEFMINTLQYDLKLYYDITTDHEFLHEWTRLGAKFAGIEDVEKRIEKNKRIGKILIRA